MVYPKDKQRAAPPTRQVRGSHEEFVGVEEDELVAKPPEEEEPAPALEEVGEEDVCEDACED